MNVQSPMMQGMVGNYLEQSKKTFVQMQEQMQKNTEQMLGAFRLNQR
jgi:polyhydroxyalkanoate synthesis regulator protein